MLKKTMTTFAALGFAAALSTAQTNAPDVEACVLALYPGTSTSTITIFGQVTSVNTPVQANIDQIANDPTTAPVNDPLPVRSMCPGFNAWRNRSGSFISRLGSGPGDRQVISVQIKGSTGAYPGSAGYVKIVDPNWVIDQVVPGRQPTGGPNALYGMERSVMPSGTGADGHGTRIDRVNGVVWWSFRGGCSFCGCEENETNMTIVLARKDMDKPQLEFYSQAGSLYSGNTQLNLVGTLVNGSRNFGLCEIDIAVYSSAQSTPAWAITIPIVLGPNFTVGPITIPTIDTASAANDTQYYIQYSLRQVFGSRTLVRGHNAVRKVGIAPTLPVPNP